MASASLQASKLQFSRLSSTFIRIPRTQYFLWTRATPSTPSRGTPSATEYSNMQRSSLRSFTRCTVPLMDGAYYFLRSGKLQDFTVSRGVRQGDSAGPLFFVLGILAVLEELRSEEGMVKFISYLDDLFELGDVDDLIQAFDKSKSKFSSAGLEVNPTKSWIYVQRPLTPAQKTALNERGITILTDGFKMLGSAHGDADFMESFLTDALDHLQSRTSALEAARDGKLPMQALFLMLKFCVGPSLVHTLRTVAPGLSNDFASKCRSILRKAAYKVAKLDPPSCRSAQCQSLLFASTSEGGVGLLDPVLIREAAYLGMCRQAAPAEYEDFHLRTREEQLALLEENPMFGPTLDAFIKRYVARLKGNVRLGVAGATEPVPSEVREDVLEEILGGNPKGLQHRLVHMLQVAEGMAMRARETDPLMKVAIRSAMGQEAGSAFSGYYHVPEARLNDRDFRSTLCLRIGYPLLDGKVDQDERCPLCHQHAGLTGWHATSCTGASMNGHTRRHTEAADAATRNIWKEFSSGISVHGTPHYAEYFTPRTVAPAGSPGKIVKGDVAISSEQKTYLLDYSVKSFSKNVMETGSKTTGALAKDAEDRKIREVNQHWVVPPNQQYMIVPFVVEVTGALGGRARNFLRVISHERGTTSSNSSNSSNPSGPSGLPGTERAEIEGRNARESAIWRVKQCIAAAVHRQNAWDVQSYVRLLSAALPA